MPSRSEEERLQSTHGSSPLATTWKARKQYVSGLSSLSGSVVVYRVDLPNLTDVGQVKVGGVVEFPVFVAFAGVEGAGVAASHGDDDVGGADDLFGPWFGEFLGDVDACSAMTAIVVALISDVGSEPAE